MKNKNYKFQPQIITNLIFGEHSWSPELWLKAAAFYNKSMQNFIYSRIGWLQARYTRFQMKQSDTVVNVFSVTNTCLVRAFCIMDNNLHKHARNMEKKIWTSIWGAQLQTLVEIYRWFLIRSRVNLRLIIPNKQMVDSCSCK